MINQLTELTNKTNEIENEILNLKSDRVDESTQMNCLNYSRNFSSLDIILPKKIYIAKIEPSKNSNIVLQMLIDLTLPTSESVEINLICGKFSIYNCKKVLNEGSNQISILQNYEPLTSEKFSVYVEIIPLTQKTIVLNYISLFAWGNLIGNSSVAYNALETNDGYLLSMLDNNCIYALNTEKFANEFNFTDLKFIDTALSYSVCYSKNTNKIYLFRVDLNGNLFYSNLSDNKENFLASNITFVSADISLNNKLLVVYVKNNQCFYFEIDENGGESLHKRLYCNFISITSVLCFYNKFRDKFLIIMTGANGNNYLIEQVNENFSNNNMVVANYSFLVTTNGSEL